ncbi:MAG: DUF1573 domain-containing protein [Planctomycetota bacterium]|jgi:hypothetical protein
MARTRITLLVLVVLLAGSLAAFAAAPRAMVDHPVVDVGKVKKGEPIRLEFVIRNAGDATLEITEVKPACGCTVAEFDARIAPGGIGRVKTVVETKSFGGAIAKSVTVFTNDSANPRLNLVVKALISEPVIARPGYARFMTVQGQPVETSVQTVSSTDGSDLEVVSVSSPYPFVKVTHRRDEGDPGRWRVELRLDPKAPAGPLADYVVVRTDHPEQAEVKIAVSGLVRPIIAVTPKVADFGRRELAEPQSKSLEVKNLGTAAVELTEATSDVAGLEAVIEPVEEGRHYRIQLTLTDELPKGEFEGRLTIFTSSLRQPVVEVPLRGTIL